MEWNKENTALLIEHFKEKRELWDSTSEHFKDRNKKHEAWMDLASKFDTEKSVVEKKMRSLIGQFQRELKKPRPGSGAEEITSKWFGFKLLLFLKVKNKVRSTNEAGIAEDNPQENCSSPRKKQKKTFNSLKAQKKAFDNLEAQKEAYGIMKQLQPECKARDQFTVFGEYIACRLRNLQDPFTISTVQNQIHNIIFQAEMRLFSGGANTIGSYDGSANRIGSYSGSANRIGSYSGSANKIGSYSGSANKIGSYSDSANTIGTDKGYYTSSLLNNSSSPADSPHTDTDTSQFSEDFDDILVNMQQSQGNNT